MQDISDKEKGAWLPLEKGFVMCGKRRRGGFHHDRAADAVAADADRRDAGKHPDAADIGGVDIRKRRGHVVAADRESVV